MGPVGRSPREDDRWHVQGTVRHGSAFFGRKWAKKRPWQGTWACLPLETTAGPLPRVAKRAPHSPQNFWGGAFRAPHSEQSSTRRIRHSPQNFSSAPLSWPHCGQRISIAASMLRASSSFDQSSGAERPHRRHPELPDLAFRGPARSLPRLTPRLCLHGCLLCRCRDIRNCGRSRELLRQCELERLVFLAPTLVTLTCRRPSRSDRRASPTACRERAP